MQDQDRNPGHQLTVEVDPDFYTVSINCRQCETFWGIGAASENPNSVTVDELAFLQRQHRYGYVLFKDEWLENYRRNNP